MDFKTDTAWLFQNIANKEGNSVEGKYSQKIANATSNNDEFIKAFVAKVGDRGGKADPDTQREQVMKLAAVVKTKFGSKLKPDYDSKFLVPVGPDEDTNERACDLMRVIGINCEPAMMLPEFDAVREWVKMDYATSRCLYG